MNYKKILIIGASGSGKSTFAKKVAYELGITYVATDSFYWDKDWQLVPDYIVRNRVMDVLLSPDWVLDGNFDNLREEVWSKADCILWLNLPFPTVIFRVVTRNLGWWLTQKEIWSGNRMTLKHAIGGIQHAMKSYWKKNCDYPAWLKEHREKEILIFTASRQAKKWLIDKSKCI